MHAPRLMDSLVALALAASIGGATANAAGPDEDFVQSEVYLTLQGAQAGGPAGGQMTHLAVDPAGEPTTLLAAWPVASASVAGADAADRLGKLLTHETVLERAGERVVRVVQRVEVEGCDAVVTTTHYAPDTGTRRMVERSRFAIEHMDRVAPDRAEETERDSLDLTAREYFTRAGDRGLSRWLDALAATRGSMERAAEMRELQFRVERGEFGRFARRNGYEMRSFLEGDPEPYYAMPLPAVSLALPEEVAGEAASAWRRYAAEHCPD